MKAEFFEEGADARNKDEAPRKNAGEAQADAGQVQAISDDDAHEMLETYFEGGIENLHEMREAAREMAGARLDRIEGEDEDCVERGINHHGEDAYARLDEHEEERQRLTLMFSPAYPTWQQISGLFANMERRFSPNERARRIRLLLTRVEQLLRYELKHSASELERLPPAPARYVAHSLQWSPLRKICFHIELAQQRLSSYSREQTGLSAPEIVDCIRAEGLRGKMKADLREFIFQKRGYTTDGPHPRPLSHKGSGGNGDDGGGLADAIWKALKEARRAPRWHRTTWAAGYGFSSYTRFFRACLLCYGMTPHQLEMALIEEILNEAEGNEKGNGGHEGHEEERKGREERRGEDEKGEDEVVKRE